MIALCDGYQQAEEFSTFMLTSFLGSVIALFEIKFLNPCVCQNQSVSD